MDPQSTRKQQVEASLKECQENTFQSTERPDHQLQAIKDSTNFEISHQQELFKEPMMNTTIQPTGDRFSLWRCKFLIMNMLGTIELKQKIDHYLKQIDKSRTTTSILIQLILTAIVAIFWASKLRLSFEEGWLQLTINVLCMISQIGLCWFLLRKYLRRSKNRKESQEKQIQPEKEFQEVGQSAVG